MKLNAKLLVIAMIIAMIFSVSAVAATSENSTALSSEFTQVPHEQVFQFLNQQFRKLKQQI